MVEQSNEETQKEAPPEQTTKGDEIIIEAYSDPALAYDKPERALRVYRSPRWLRAASSLVYLWTQPVNRNVVHPRKYLSASHEVFGLTLILSWIINLSFFRDQITDHPARPIIGSFNPCFGWDYAPTSYIALTLCSCNVYFTWRYAWLEKVRNALKNPRNESPTNAQRFGNVTASFLALASNTWLLLWVIGPNVDKPGQGQAPQKTHWTVHTLIFVTYAAASWLAVLGNYLEVATGPNKINVKRKHTVFLIIYGLSFLLLVIVYLVNLSLYEEGSEPTVPPAITQVSDVVWVASMASITSFLPPEPPLKVTIEFATIEEDEELALE